MSRVLLTLLACAASPPAPEPQPAVPADEPVVSEAVTLMRPLQVAAQLGTPGRPMVVNFWATWCGPCREEQPRLHAWAKAHPEARMVWVSLDLPKLRERAVMPALSEGGFLDGVVEHWQLDDRDPAMAMGKLLPTWKGVVPTTLVIDAQGQVLATHSRALNDDDLPALEAMLSL